MMPVPVESTVPVRISFERSSQATISSKRRLSCAGARLAREDLAPAARARGSAATSAYGSGISSGVTITGPKAKQPL